jgi:hypothetical protein
MSVIVTNVQYGLVSGGVGVKGIDISLVFVIPCVLKPKNFVERTFERLSASPRNFCGFDHSTLSEFELHITS